MPLSTKEFPYIKYKETIDGALDAAGLNIIAGEQNEDKKAELIEKTAREIFSRLTFWRVHQWQQFQV